MNEIETLIAKLTGGDDEQAEASIPELAAHGAAALAALRPLLADPSADTRWWALRALAEIPHPQAPALLLQALEDEDIPVRQCAAIGLRRQPHDRAIPVLVGALSSKDQLLASLAGDALEATGPAAVPALLEVMRSGVQTARLVAVRALARIADPRAIPVLYEALGEDSMIIQHWAEEGLHRMGVGMAYFKP